ncbi:MAG TPA: hypothetical protein PKY81_08750 [bacterium]|nr:hypothetical protein [bacterium]HPN31033.1 hypothetical protein [bacterium]
MKIKFIIFLSLIFFAADGFSVLNLNAGQRVSSASENSGLLDNLIENGKYYEILKMNFYNENAGWNYRNAFGSGSENNTGSDSKTFASYISLSKNADLRNEINYWFALIKLNRPERSLTFLSSVIEKYGKSSFYNSRILTSKIVPVLKYLEGYNFLSLGDYENAIKSFDYFLNFKEEYFDAETLIQDNYLKLAFANLKMNRTEEAKSNIEIYDKIKSVDRFAQETLFYKAASQLGNDGKIQIDEEIWGDTSDVINSMFYASLYKELYKNGIFYADCEYLLAAALNNLGRAELAVKQFNVFLTKSGFHSKTDKTLYLLAKYYSGIDKNISLSYYRQLINGFNESPYWMESFYFLVQYYFNEKKYAEIIKYADVLKSKISRASILQSYKFECDDLLYYFALSFEMNVYYKEAAEFYGLYKTKFKNGFHYDSVDNRIRKLNLKK